MAKGTRTSKAESEVKRKNSTRNAGILLHVTSLPSPFGIGNLGPEAKKFIDFLIPSKQSYWQLLPLNPTGPEQGYSPYSSISSMAGNVMLVSPEDLAAEGLIKLDRSYSLKSDRKENFRAAGRLLDEILSAAYKTFLGRKKLQDHFAEFCEREAFWLDDFANYVSLKKYNNRKAWYEWPAQFKNSSSKAVSQFAIANESSIRYIKWLQYIFLKQWQGLKAYANANGIRMFGDLPFYVSYDSADVWAHPEFFNISKNGNMIGVAGVPPDYFNSNGQLWGMPTFNWKILKEKNYAWWIQRLRKNMELYDLLRLDHFRAFADYWEVPVSERTAKRGEWKPGPGSSFFRTVQNEFGDLPFIAEDLGDINDAVYQLRDNFGLPGMKVLQFAFGDSMPTSPYIPHNYNPNFFVYTGTHDNNTTRGWFQKDISKQTRLQITDYVGKPVNEKNIAIELARLAYSSVAKTVMLPMQDVLGLDGTARMNTPASVKNNWGWRLAKKFSDQKVEERLAEWTALYGRMNLP
jgi:4-alpha-glucanotransferase